MIVIGVILLVVVVVFSASVLLEAGDAVDLSVIGFGIETNVRGVFLLGAGALLVLVLAAGFLIKGLKHSAQRRREVRQLRDEVQAREARPRGQGRPAPRRTTGPYDGPDPYDGHFDSTPRE